MSWVGIIANPASGKDIRRVVSHALTFDNPQKVNVVRRIVLALHTFGVTRVEIMPDLYGIGTRALHGLKDQPEIQSMTTIVDMNLEGTAEDTLAAARYFREAGAGCIIVLGGDGTTRVTAKESGNVPLLPISTGTNNVVPLFVEGTIAGLAGAFVASSDSAAQRELCFRHKKLVVTVNGDEVDSALVDVAVVVGQFAGARAVWEVNRLRQVFVTRTVPVNIGLSAAVGVLRSIRPTDPWGAGLTIAPDATEQEQVNVPIAPGRFVPIGVGEIITLEADKPCPITGERPAVLALDGERELELVPGDEASVTLNLEGPWIVDVEKTLKKAVETNAFRLQS